MNVSILVVCSDDRAGELAAVLSSSFDVFRRWRKGGAWIDSVWVNGEWHSPVGGMPKSFDVLFFHTGQNDEKGIPIDLAPEMEFAFSGAGVGAKEVPCGRESAIPIQRKFLIGDCPVKASHLQELKDLLRERRSEVPSFCRPQASVPALCSISILCQAYAAALYAVDGDENFDEWGTIYETFRNAGPRLEAKVNAMIPFLQDMRRESWWKALLGLWDEVTGTADLAALKDFLVQFAHDLEIDDRLARQLNIKDLRLANDLLKLKELFDKVEKPECARLVVAFLYSTEPWVCAPKVYSSIESFLDKR